MVISSFAIGSSCIAATTEFANQNSISGIGPYFGAQFGVGGMNLPDFPSSAKSAVEQNNGHYSKDISWGFVGRLFGGYLWNTNKFHYGLELGGMMYPSNKYNLEIKTSEGLVSNDVTINIRYNGYFIDLLGVAKYYFTPAWNIFIKEGIAYAYQKVSVHVVDDNTITGIISAYETKRKREAFPEIALGMGYHVIPSAELNLTYNHVFGNDLSLDSASSRAKVASVDGVMLGVTWYFS